MNSPPRRDQLSAEILERQIAMKQEFEDDRASRPEKVIASAAGSSNPAHPVINLSDGNWRLRLNNVAGTTVISDTWELAGDDRINLVARQYYPTTDAYHITRKSNQTLSCEWVRTPGSVRSVNETWTGRETFSKTNEWHLLDKVPSIYVRSSGTTNFDMTSTIRFPDGWGYYHIQIRAGHTILAEKTVQGSSTIFKTVPLTINLSVSNATIAPNTDVFVYYMRWGQAGLKNSAITSITTRASWTERKV
jgi:hypothetical protein